ncbi:MAG: helix-turn-helix transcriptional regulator [Bacilli bacterium]|nr:helix-turn-helix transcriptional regulator [Bacilli bacterium]
MKVSLNEYGKASFIRIIREWTGLTQKEFAKLLGKSERQIQGYESGTSNYSIKTLETIAKELNISITAEKQSKRH